MYDSRLVILGEPELRRWREDGGCGRKYPRLDGTRTECNPDGDHPCCNSAGECGNTTEHCTGAKSIDYRKVKKWRQEGKMTFL